jgi:hypothetical protein
MKASTQVTLSLSLDTDVAELKYKVLVELGLDPSTNALKLLFKGKVLMDDKRLGDYPGIEDGANINVMTVAGKTVSPSERSSQSTKAATPVSNTATPRTKSKPGKESVEEASKSLSVGERLSMDDKFWKEVSKVVDDSLSRLEVWNSNTELQRILDAFQQALKTVSKPEGR